MANLELLIKKCSGMKAKLMNIANHLKISFSCDTLSDLKRIDLQGRLINLKIYTILSTNYRLRLKYTPTGQTKPIKTGPSLRNGITR